LSIKYKSYWRKSGLKGKWGDIYLSRLNIYKPKNILEIGVFCGVTARNTCDFLNKVNSGEFSYIGIDLFGKNKSTSTDEMEPRFLLNQKFSNPLKNIYYNFILKENLNSITSVQKLLRKYNNSAKLIAGDTNSILKEIDLKNIDFVFLDGGHSYQTVYSDLTKLYEQMKDKKKVMLCDDYGKESYIPDVEKAIKDFTNRNNLQLNLIENRFAEIIT
tara:strand:- start:9 stop:656 length:648 start_codon:yes stop_codon:yes gene_type:complete